MMHKRVAVAQGSEGNRRQTQALAAFEDDIEWRVDTAENRLPLHELADLFPAMVDADFEALVQDVTKRGQIEPAWVHDGKVIDGRHRARACERIGQPLRYRTYRGDDPLGFVIALNLVRRHLDESQRAMVAAKMANMEQGHRSDLQPSANLQKVSQEDAAKMLNVSTRTVASAAKVRKEADPEVVQAVERGVISVAAAADVAKLKDKDKQRALVTGPKQAVKKAVKGVKRMLAVQAVEAAAVESTIARPRIVIADAREWLREQPMCDLLLTDPPYSTDVDDIAAFAASWLPLALSKVKPTGRAYVCVGAYPRELAAYLAVAMPAQVLVWTYNNAIGPAPLFDYRLNWQAILYYRMPEALPLDVPLLNEHFAAQVINAPDGRLGTRFHAWQKPDELADRIIRHATEPGALVLDPFACTGTFVLAANRLGRVGYGCEIDRGNAAIAVERGCEIEN